MKMTIKVFTSKNCQPCQEVSKLLKEGKYQGDIEIIDIETDEGFETFTKEVLAMGPGAVPSAYRDGKKCLISISEDNSVLFNCPTAQSAEQPSLESPPAAGE
jgi:predicted thioredoxin/glutaredoxin